MATDISTFEMQQRSNDVRNCQNFRLQHMYNDIFQIQELIEFYLLPSINKNDVFETKKWANRIDVLLQRSRLDISLIKSATRDITELSD